VFTNELEAVDAAPLELFFIGFKDFSGSSDRPVDLGPFAVCPLPLP
jgi:hypothetical protein